MRVLLVAAFAILGTPSLLLAQNTVTIPAGTRILVRTSEALSSGRHQTGARFTTKLEAAITVNGAVVVPAGATVYGRVKEARAARRIRRAKLVVELTDVEINGQLYPIVTNEAGAEGGPNGTVAKVGAGALVGAAAGDAAAGAAVGGAVALLSQGQQIDVPADFLAEFQTTQPASLPMTAGAAAAPQPAAQPAAQPAPPPPPPVQEAAEPAVTALPEGGFMLPAGTRLMVRTVDAIGSGTHSTGARFEVKLSAAISAGNTVVVPAGAPVFGRVTEAVRAGRLARRPKLVIELSDLSINGQLVPIVTNQAGAEGGPQGTVARVGAGALIGAAAGDAAAGAAVGGAVALLSPGNQIVVPPGTLVEFRLTQPVTVR